MGVVPFTGVDRSEKVSVYSQFLTAFAIMKKPDTDRCDLSAEADFKNSWEEQQTQDACHLKVDLLE